MKFLFLIPAVAIGFTFSVSGQTTDTLPASENTISAEKETRAKANSAQFQKETGADEAKTQKTASFKREAPQVNNKKQVPAGNKNYIEESEKLPASAGDKKSPAANGKKYIDESEKAPANAGGKKAPILNGKGYIDEAK